MGIESKKYFRSLALLALLNVGVACTNKDVSTQIPTNGQERTTTSVTSKPVEEDWPIQESGPRMGRYLKSFPMPIDSPIKSYCYTLSPNDIFPEATGEFFWPTGLGPITTSFDEIHQGIDIAAPHFTSIYAADGGKVGIVHFQKRGGYGNYTVINHGRGRFTLYAHLAEIQVKVGQMVDRGESLATEGSTGRSTGPHLHLEVFQKNSEDGSCWIIDPEELLP